MLATEKQVNIHENRIETNTQRGIDTAAHMQTQQRMS